MKKIYKNGLIIVILLIILVVNLLKINIIVDNILDYTQLFIEKVFPVTFIFLTISNLLLDNNLIQILQRIFKFKSTNIYIFILSLISGFPSGAIYTKEILEKDLININDANKMIMFSHFPNPLFVINSVSLILNDLYLSYIILLSLIISNFVILIFNNNVSNYINSNITYKDFSTSLFDNIIKSFKTILNIYGISLFFFLIASIINMFTHNKYLYVIVFGIFDLTKGIFSTILINNIFLRALIIIILISFGPLSIHFQVKSILTDTNIKYLNYFKGRIVSCLLSLSIFTILFFMIHHRIDLLHLMILNYLIDN